MKLLSLALAIGLGVSSWAGSPSLPRLAVLDLSIQSNESAVRLDEPLRDRVATAFLQTRRFEVLERIQLQPLVKELRFQREGLVDAATMVELGRLRGVELALLGQAQVVVGLRAFDIHLDLRLVEVRSGQVKESLHATGSGGSFNLERAQSEALEDLTVNLGTLLLQRYPARGLVLKVLEDGKALIDLGARDGMRRGQRLRTFQMERLLHSAKGTSVEEVAIPTGELEVREVYETTSLVRSRSKAPLLPGCPVERLP